MAISDHIRARKRPPRSRPAAGEVTAGVTARAARPPSPPITLPAWVLRTTALHLLHIRAAASTAAAALHHQNAEIDADVALTLRHAVIDPLTLDIERLQGLLEKEEKAPC